ncbi:MAG: TPM domain-containing protein [Ignavibacteriaceae bacterium]|nr:TPM domain-containing protein [Ignavibacteriaceae bacterium]
MKKRLIYKYFDDDDFLRISRKISSTEKLTSGEICVSIKEYPGLLGKKKSVRQLAEEEFYRVGINKTRDKTGVLIFLLLSEKKFYILADRGINEKVKEDTWEKVKDNMLSFFSRGLFCKGIISGIDEVGSILSKHFPIKPGDTNELSNRIIID